MLASTPCAVYLPLVSLYVLPYHATAADFNLEVGFRVIESLEAYMTHLPNYCKLFLELHENHLFEFGMTPPDGAS